MTNKPPNDKASEGTLQRGKACLRCRKRKMRCDGAKPACQQCSRAKKADACEYDDGKSKTRTQLLREMIAKLEHRVRELEDPEYMSPSVTLFDPHDNSRSGSSTSSLDSPESSYLSAIPQSEFSASWTQLQAVHPPSLSVPNIFFDEQQTLFHPPIELALMLLDIFAPHSRQCGLEMHMGQLRESLSRPIPEQRHPTFMNAIYLWACFVSRPEPLSQHEDHYLRHSLESLPYALRLGCVIDVIQASCLLAMYYFANGRLIEGGYHCSAAAALALQSGLGQRIPSNIQSALVIDGLTEISDFKPQKTDMEAGEKILAFWQVYNLDRCWSVVLRRHSIIPDGPDPRNAFHCPWPQHISDYQKGHLDTVTQVPNIGAFPTGSVSANGFSVSALRVKASTLFFQADRLAAECCPGMNISTNLFEGIRNLEHAITLFLSTLIPVDQFDTVLPEDKHSLIIAHTLAYSATIHLHRPFSAGDSVSFEKCSQAARSCISIIKYIGERDFAFLDPIIGPCWWSVADNIIGRLDALETSWLLIDRSDVVRELSTLTYAMTNYSAHFPIVSSGLSRIQKRLAQF